MVLGVAGSNPVSHPTFLGTRSLAGTLLLRHVPRWLVGAGPNGWDNRANARLRRIATHEGGCPRCSRRLSVSDDFETRMQAAAAGDRAAYDQLFEHNLPALIAYLRAKVGGELAERESVRDLAQSVCREVLRDLDKLEFRAEEQFRAYLFLQAARKVVDRYRYHKQEMRDPARLEQLPAESDEVELMGMYAGLTPSRAAGAKEELTRVEQALQLLPEAQRDAVLLSRIAGLGYQEIARQKGISEAAVRGLVARGLARLAGLLGQPPA